jgi:hypothetical protein
MIAIQKQSLDCKAGEGARSPYATIQSGDLIRRDTEQKRQGTIKSESRKGGKDGNTQESP